MHLLKPIEKKKPIDKKWDPKKQFRCSKRKEKETDKSQGDKWQSNDKTVAPNSTTHQQTSRQSLNVNGQLGLKILNSKERRT